MHEADMTLRDRVVALETRFETLHPRVKVVEDDVCAIQQRLDSIDTRLSKLERALLGKGAAILILVEVGTLIAQHFLGR